MKFHAVLSIFPFQDPAKHHHSKHTSDDAKYLQGAESNWKCYRSAKRITLCAFVRPMPWFMYSLTARSSSNHRHHLHRSLISKILELVAVDIVAEWQKKAKRLIEMLMCLRKQKQ